MSPRRTLIWRRPRAGTDIAAITSLLPLHRDDRPILLDLFCGAGGASTGYARAGFRVIGADSAPQPNYPFEFVQGDAMQILDAGFLGQFDAIHASPPCQHYTTLALGSNNNADEWPDLVEPVRHSLVASGVPYVIENVPGAPLIDPIMLCGTMFPGLRVHRHRNFEASILLEAPEHLKPKEHPLVFTHDKRSPWYRKLNEWENFVQVTGFNSSLAAAKDAMGIDWMTVKKEVNEAIPPAYAQWIGQQLIEHVRAAA